MQLKLSLKSQHALRVAIATALAILISRWLIMPRSYWVTISALVIVQPNIGATFLRAQQRSISTLLDVLIGAMLVILIHQILWLTALLGLISLFLGIYFFQMNYVKVIFFFSVLLMLIFGLYAPNIWQFVFYRFFDTLLGVGIGFMASLLLWPVSAGRVLRQDLIQTIKNSQPLVDLVFSQLVAFSLEEQMQIGESRVAVYQNLQLAKQHFEDMRHEFALLTVKRAAAFAIISTMEKMRLTLYAINSVSASEEKYSHELKIYLKAFRLSINKLLCQYVGLLEKSAVDSTIGLYFIPSDRFPSFPVESLSSEQSFLKYNLLHLELELNHLYYACRRFLRTEGPQLI